MAQPFDVIIVGLGAVGMATLMHLAKAGRRVLGLDRFDPPHAMGSSHGETRITRLSIGEGAAYLPLVQRSHEIWPDLEAQTGLSCFTKTGGLFLDSGSSWGKKGGRSEGFVKRTIALAQASGIPHEILSARDIQARFPAFSVTDRAFGYYEPDAGFVRPEAAIAAQKQIALRHGASLRLHEEVLRLEATPHNTVLVASCCSGHGFKHSAALGEALAANLGGHPSPLDLQPFRRPWSPHA